MKENFLDVDEAILMAKINLLSELFGRQARYHSKSVFAQSIEIRAFRSIVAAIHLHLKIIPLLAILVCSNQ
jgi:hypothetical protein